MCKANTYLTDKFIYLLPIWGDGESMEEVDDIKKRKMEEMLKANAAPAEPIHATDENFDQLLKDNCR
jgi:hypothetical protein